MTAKLQEIFNRLLAGHGIEREEVAMLHSAILQPPVSMPTPGQIGDMPEAADNSFSDDELAMMAYGNNPRANAYRELLRLRVRLRDHVSLVGEGKLQLAVDNAAECIRQMAFHIDASTHGGEHLHRYMLLALGELEAIKHQSSIYQANELWG